jgi:hypothetical protein
VRTLFDWYRAAVDVGRRLHRLSTLGHVDPSAMYWYLLAAPELLALAAERLEPDAETIRERADQQGLIARCARCSIRTEDSFIRKKGNLRRLRAR